MEIDIVDAPKCTFVEMEPGEVFRMPDSQVLMMVLDYAHGGYDHQAVTLANGVLVQFDPYDTVMRASVKVVNK